LLNLVELTRDDLPTNWMTVNVMIVHHIVPVVHIQVRRLLLLRVKRGNFALTTQTLLCARSRSSWVR
jgi:hypothetical protein